MESGCLETCQIDQKRVPNVLGVVDCWVANQQLGRPADQSQAGNSEEGNEIQEANVEVHDCCGMHSASEQLSRLTGPGGDWEIWPILDGDTARTNFELKAFK